MQAPPTGPAAANFMAQMQPADLNKMQSMPPQDQTMIWAQQNYAVDSGIHTSCPTSSVLSGASGHTGASYYDDFAAATADPYNTPCYTQDQINSFNADYDAARAGRIRAAMFPETITENMDVSGAGPGTQFDFGQSTNVQRLTEPGHLLKNAVINIINYQSDADRTLKAIPDFIALLSDEDKLVASHAAQFIHHLSRVDAACRVLADSPELIGTVLQLMKASDNDTETAKHTVGTLYYVSGHPSGLMAIFRSGGIEALVRLLESTSDSVLYYAITTLHNLILHQQGSKEVIKRANGIALMVNLLKTKSLAKFLAIVVDCLYNLALNQPDTKAAILRSGGPAELVRVLKTFDYEKLLWTTSRLIQVLSVCQDNKKAIIQAGGLQALTPHLSHMSQRLVRTILLDLRNLSDAAVDDENVEPLLIALLQLMGSSDYEVVLCCVCILSNLSCNNIRNKATICRNDGVKCLLRTLETFAAGSLTIQSSMELLEPTLCTLRHITTRHVDEQAAQNEFRLYRSDGQRNGVQLIADFIHTQPAPLPSVPLMLARPAMGILRNLASHQGIAAQMCDYGVVQNVCTYLIRCYQAVQQAQRANTVAPMMDGVKCVEMIETCACALQALCKTPLNRTYVRQANVVPVLVQLLYYDTELIQSFAAGTLAEIVNDPEGAQLIEQNGAVPQLTELLHSRNENIATYAAAVLRALGRTKPEDYQKHLGVELTSSLLRDDSAPWSQDVLNELPQVNEDAFDLYNAGFDPSMNYDLTNPAYGGLIDYDPMDGGPSSAASHVTPPPAHHSYVGSGAGGGYPASNVAPSGGLVPHQQQRAPPGGGAHNWYDTNL